MNIMVLQEYGLVTLGHDEVHCLYKSSAGYEPYSTLYSLSECADLCSSLEFCAKLTLC